MNHRKEIDGLRALAIIPVILFHAGIQAFSGGFVGVDVFFVISGYLITSIILVEQKAGTFSLVSFYERRARRILPALFVVMLTCLPFAYLWMFPGELVSFSRSLRYVSLFSSNILFFKQSSYFDTAAELKPLLHTWSLAVEEQYYLVFPIFLLLVWRFGKRWVVSILVVMAIISLAASQWGSFHEPAATFFLLPTRVWELLIGVFIAFYLFTQETNKTISQIASQVVSTIGMLMIIYAVIAFDKNTPFPSLYALIPTVGAGLIILYATPQTYVGRLLSSKLLVGIGLISYSAYLWHQPLFAFARHASIDEPSAVELLTLSLVACALAYVSWRFVEKPFRAKHTISRTTVFAGASLMSIFFISVAEYGKFREGFEDKLSMEQRAVYSYTRYAIEELDIDGMCLLRREQTYRDFAPLCDNTHDNKAKVLIWGDSHAAALSRGLRSLFPSVVQYTATECPPLVDSESIASWRPRCTEVNSFVMQEVERFKPNKIFLHAYWTFYEQHNPAVNVGKTIDAIRRVSPSSEIFIIGGVPQWSTRGLPVILLMNHIKLDKEAYLSNASLGPLEALDTKLRLSADSKGVSYLSAVESLCKEGKCQIVAKLNNRFQPTARDYGHLTEAGAVLLAKKLLAQISKDDDISKGRVRLAGHGN